jgi:AcrR family transcriptional regulator
MADLLPHRPTDARTRVLDAAESIVLARGVPALTLDSVAKLAGVSKGGLLYHFASKEALLRGLVDRIEIEMQADWQSALNRTPPGAAHASRTVLTWAFHCPPEEEANLMRRGAVLLAAHHHDPKLLDPVRRLHAAIRAAVEQEGLAPGAGLAVMAACDGLFVAALFGIWQPTQDESTAIEATLARLIAESSATARNLSQPGSALR